ncbi:MAG: aspartate-semialdehyde dehydrogenase [Candidatus Eremiobacteraeota bacterium]|nr:aspartate-semialdehyde dehydrogenase [Candidatus Eremiobacteraeota bacterium]MBV8365224.1 aspartate-semialdehyde dehydrogenase [Candidatus Eremiobacteraeota bacterium]
MSRTEGGLSVAIVGAGGVVGETLARILDERRFALASLRAFGTQRSAGQRLQAGGQSATIEQLEDSAQPFHGIDVAFFAAGDAVSQRYARAAVDAGALVVDKSGVFRLDDSTPLVVPEANAGAIGPNRLIANPNCSTIPLAVMLAPIEREFGLAWVSVATYQSVSGAGKDALAEFEEQARGGDAVKFLPRRVVGNVIPENGAWHDDGYGEEERKIAAELKKILRQPNLPVSATAVRVPVAVGHSEAVSFMTARPASRDQIAEVLRSAPSIRFYEGSQYAAPLEVAGKDDDVHVGRLRPDTAHAGGFLCWVVCDNLRKGAATNAVQIVEHALNASRVAV